MFRDETSAIDHLHNCLVQRFHAIALVDQAVHAQLQQSRQHLGLRDHGHYDHARPLRLPQETPQKRYGIAFAVDAPHANVGYHDLARKAIDPVCERFGVYSRSHYFYSRVSLKPDADALSHRRMIVCYDNPDFGIHFCFIRLVRDGPRVSWADGYKLYLYLDDF